MPPPRRWQIAYRNRFLRRRARGGLRPPAPSLWRVCNADSVSAGPRRAEQIIGAAAAGDDVVVVGGVEAFDADVPFALGPSPAGWTVAADQSDDEARRGAFLAVRNDRARIDRWWIRATVRPFARRNGRRVRLGMRTRYEVVALVTVDPWTEYRWGPIKVKVGHGPPPRLGALWPRWGARFRHGRADVYMGDGNAKADRMQRTLRRRMRQLPGDVMFLAARWWLPLGPIERTVVPGADHRIVGATLWHRSAGPDPR